MKNIQAERNTSVDIMRAILIIAMVTGHSTSPWTTYIYLFHMPAFLVLSGYVDRGEKYKTGQYVRKKFFTILLPALMINAVYIAFYCIMQLTGAYDMISSSESISLWERVKGMLMYWATPDFGGATWFLVVLFEVQCIVKIIGAVLQRYKRDRVFIPCIFALGVGGYMLVVRGCMLRWYVDLALLGCLYYGIGILVQRKTLLSYLDRKVMLPFAVISTIFFGSFYFKGEIPMNWPTRDFTNLFIQFWSCLAPMYIVWNAAFFLNSTFAAPCLQWIGRHTYCILVLHFAVFRVLFGIGVLMGKFPVEQLQHLTPDAEIAYRGGWAAFVVITVCLCGLVAKLSEKNRWTDYLFNAKLPCRF